MGLLPEVEEIGWPVEGGGQKMETQYGNRKLFQLT